MNYNFMGLEGTDDSKGEQKKGASSESRQWKLGYVGSHVVFYLTIFFMTTGSKLCIYVYFLLQTQITLKYSLGL